MRNALKIVMTLATISITTPALAGGASPRTTATLAGSEACARIALMRLTKDQFREHSLKDAAFGLLVSAAKEAGKNPMECVNSQLDTKDLKIIAGLSN